MKAAPILSILLASFVVSCSQDNTNERVNAKPQPKEIVVQAFQDIIDESALNGAILLYNPKTNEWFSNDFNWTTVPRLPASTFKIPNSIIALETGVVEDANTMFPWDGKPRRLKSWEQDLNFKEAFHYSCVPCYQEVARKVGADRMKSYVKQFDYGKMDVSEENLDVFWLEGNSRISPKEQIQFLERFYNGELPISERTEEMMKSLMLITESNSYTLSGKTGWAIRHGKNNAWFVGYVETNGQPYYFATNISPIAAFDMNKFTLIRNEVTMKALQEQGIIPQ